MQLNSALQVVATAFVDSQEYQSAMSVILASDEEHRLAILEALRASLPRDSDSRLDEPRAHLVEFGASGEDMEDDLRERSENINLAREDAYERGQDAYTADGNRDAMAAQYYDHPKLRTDFCDGWEDAKTESGDDCGPHADARVRQAMGDATGVDNQPS